MRIIGLPNTGNFPENFLVFILELSQKLVSRTRATATFLFIGRAGILTFGQLSCITGNESMFVISTLPGSTQTSRVVVQLAHLPRIAVAH